MSDECTCHISPPCNFCVSLTEEEVDAYASGGADAVHELRRQNKADPFNAIVPAWLPPGDHYVMVVESDSFSPHAPRFAWDQYGIPYQIDPYHSGPITWEHYIGDGTKLEEVGKRRSAMGNRCGRTAIARLVFVEADQ
jgi:hypothetical protein